MTSKERKALAAEAPKTDTELTLLVERLQQIQTEREGIIAKRDERRATLLAKLEQRFSHDANIAKLDVLLNAEMVKLEAWADANRAARFTEKKSIEIGGAVFGWHAGNWKTETVKRTTWKEIVARLMSFVTLGKMPKATVPEWRRATAAEQFIRTTIEADKAAMIAKRDDQEAMAVLLEAGAQVVQEESFFFKRAGEGQEPALIKSEG